MVVFPEASALGRTRVDGRLVVSECFENNVGFVRG